MKKILRKVSTWKFLLPIFILFLLFPVYLFPHYQGRMAQAAGQEVTPLDSHFSYTYEEVKNNFDQLGPDGRNVYRFVIGKIDMVFPIAYGSLFILMLAWLLKKIFREDSAWILLALFPLIGVVFDYLENINTLSLLDGYPAITEGAVLWGSQMTQLKQIFLLTSVGFMAVLGLALLIKSVMWRRQRP